MKNPPFSGNQRPNWSGVQPAPEDVMKAAYILAVDCINLNEEKTHAVAGIIARAIMAERDRCAKLALSADVEIPEWPSALSHDLAVYVVEQSRDHIAAAIRNA